MIFLSIMGNSFGCSAAGERLVSAARDGDLPEARALLEYNPRLARYSTFGVRNSPLHYSASQGHHEIVSLLLECGVEINLRNYRGQTALMQSCLYGHWEAVQTLVLFRANIHKKDYLNGGTALHFAALNGHSRCIRLLLSDYVPSVADFWNIMRKLAVGGHSGIKSDTRSLNGILNKPADGGITALHMAALNGHADTVQLLLDLGASFTKVTVDDGTTIDLIGSGSTPLHYAACGGNMQCCQILISRGASLIARNANGYAESTQSACLFQVDHGKQPIYEIAYPTQSVHVICMTPLMVARSWHRNCLEGILSKQPEGRPRALPSPYLSLPLMSIVKIARECGRTDKDPNPACVDPCAICLERKCTVAAGGCKHEFCTKCALYLCSTNSSSTSSPPGSIACPLCRHGIVTFVKLPGTSPIKEMAQVSFSLSSSTACPNEGPEATSEPMPFCRSELSCTQISPLVSASLGALSLHRFPSMRLNSSLCMRAPHASPPPTSHEGSSRITHSVSSSCSRSSFRRSVSHNERTSCFSFNQYVATSSG